jgi:Hemerythrin HHE cation binding domain
MFDLFSNNSKNAIDILKKDHDKVKDLFDEFEKAGNRLAKKKIAGQALGELKVHAAIEEEIFYPAVRKQLEKKVMNEADEEHHVAKVLIAELDVMDGHEDHYDAKFQVLSENVRHHIKEEERDMLPKAKGLDLDFDALGEKMLRRKDQLIEKGVPAAGEEAMVKASHGQGDSPAKAARKTLKRLQSARKPASNNAS